MNVKIMFSGIYSIYILLDNLLLSNIYYLTQRLHFVFRFSAITCTTAKLRSANEIEKLQSRAFIKTEQVIFGNNLV